jgi:hypothetical protein
MSADWSWVPERARFAAAGARLGLLQDGTIWRRRGRILGSTWIGEGNWCYIDSGSTDAPTAGEIPGFNEAGVVGDLVAAGEFPAATRGSLTNVGGCIGVYFGRALVAERYAALVEAIWPGVIWRSRGEREPVAAYAGSRPVALVAPIADNGGEAMVRAPDPVESAEARRLADVEREARRGQALRAEIERLAAHGEGYASALDLRRALALKGSEA